LNWKFWVGIMLSALFLFLAVRKVDFQELSVALRSAEYIYLLPAAVLSIVSLGVRAFRWRYLLNHIRPIGFSSLFSATMIGFMANNIFPARLGEFVRAYAIGHMEDIPKSASFATIVLERIFDGLTILFFLGVVILFGRLPIPPWLERAAYGAMGFYVVAMLILILMKIYPERSLRIVSQLARPLPRSLEGKLVAMTESFIHGLGILHSFRNIVMVCLLSLVVWILPALATHSVLIASHISITFSGAILMMVILCLGVMVPSAPGFIGTIQFLCVTGLAIFSIPKGQALGFSFLFHAVQYIPVTVVGFICLFAEGMTLSQMRQSSAIYSQEESKQG